MERSGRDADRSAEAAEVLRGKEGAKREKIRRARPVAGEIDHGALTRQIIARFPKILAELAE